MKKFGVRLVPKLERRQDEKKTIERGIMSTDLYVKTVLTVIAGCLLWICTNGVTPPALAQAKPAEPARVILVDERNVPLSTIQGLHVNLGLQTVPVSIANPSIAVRVTSIERTGSWQPIDVRVLRDPPTLMPTP